MATFHDITVPEDGVRITANMDLGPDAILVLSVEPLDGKPKWGATYLRAGYGCGTYHVFGVGSIEEFRTKVARMHTLLCKIANTGRPMTFGVDDPKVIKAQYLRVGAELETMITMLDPAHRGLSSVRINGEYA